MRYSPDQLRAMARRALQARDEGNDGWTLLCLQIALRCEISPSAVPARIEELAR